MLTLLSQFFSILQSSRNGACDGCTVRSSAYSRQNGHQSVIRVHPCTQDTFLCRGPRPDCNAEQEDQRYNVQKLYLVQRRMPCMSNETRSVLSIIVETAVFEICWWCHGYTHIISVLQRLTFQVGYAMEISACLLTNQSLTIKSPTVRHITPRTSSEAAATRPWSP